MSVLSYSKTQKPKTVWIKQHFGSSLAPRLLALFSVVVAVWLIVWGEAHLSVTYDEGVTVACGMEWLDLKTFVLEPLHPPLARASTALLPYLAGVRFTGPHDKFAAANPILEWGGKFHRNLFLARLGILPYFLMACFLSWLLVRRWFGPWQAALSVLFLAFCPVALGISSLANTDAALMSTFLFAIMAILYFCFQPDYRSALLCSLAVCCAVLTKLSALPFLVFALAPMLFLLLRHKIRLPSIKLLGVFAVAFCLLLWSVYRFEVNNFDSYRHLKILHHMRQTAWIFNYLWLPAPGFFEALIDLFSKTDGRVSYALGHVYDGGRWYFYPLCLVTKTPIPMLLFFVAGLWAGLTKVSAENRFRSKLLLLAFLGPVLVGVLTKMNIGMRHVLPCLPFMAMLAALGVCHLWSAGRSVRSRFWLRAVIVLLCVWQVASCTLSAPNLFAYFNEPSRPYATYLLTDSNLDWGQDVGLLGEKLREFQVRDVRVDLLSSANLQDYGINHASQFDPHAAVLPAGWFAVSEFPYATTPGLHALDPLPYTRIGVSIRLYHLATGIEFGKKS